MAGIQTINMLSFTINIAIIHNVNIGDIKIHIINIAILLLPFIVVCILILQYLFFFLEHPEELLIPL